MPSGVANSMSRTTVMGLPTDNDSLGTAVSYLTTLTPQDPRFRLLLSYRWYRLKDRSGYVTPENISHRGRWTKSLTAAMENTIFTGNKPIKLLRWLETFCAQCDGNGIPETMAVSMALEFLSSPAHEAYRAAYTSLAGTPRPVVFNTWRGLLSILPLRTLQMTFLTKQLRSCGMSSKKGPKLSNSTMMSYSVWLMMSLKYLLRQILSRLFI